MGKKSKRSKKSKRWMSQLPPGKFIFAAYVVPAKSQETGEIVGYARISVWAEGNSPDNLLYLRDNFVIQAKDFNDSYAHLLFASEDEAMQAGYDNAVLAGIDGALIEVK